MATERTERSGAASTPQHQAAAQIQIDDSNAQSLYSNFCRVTGTPEELILDFGLSSQAFGVPTGPVTVSQRVITNYYTAKRLLHVLQLTLDRHEGAFGALETDVQRRIQRP